LQTTRLFVGKHLTVIVNVNHGLNTTVL